MTGVMPVLFTTCQISVIKLSLCCKCYIHIVSCLLFRFKDYCLHVQRSQSERSQTTNLWIFPIVSEPCCIQSICVCVSPCSVMHCRRTWCSLLSTVPVAGVPARHPALNSLTERCKLWIRFLSAGAGGQSECLILYGYLKQNAHLRHTAACV